MKRKKKLTKRQQRAFDLQEATMRCVGYLIGYKSHALQNGLVMKPDYIEQFVTYFNEKNFQKVDLAKITELMELSK